MKKLTPEQRDWIMKWFVDNGLQSKRQTEVRVDYFAIEGFLNTLTATPAEDAQLDVGKEEWLDIMSSGPTYVSEEITSPIMEEKMIDYKCTENDNVISLNEQENQYEIYTDGMGDRIVISVSDMNSAREFFSAQITGVPCVEGEALTANTAEDEPIEPQMSHNQIALRKIEELHEWQTKFREVDGTSEMKKVASEFARKYCPGWKGWKVYTVLRDARIATELVMDWLQSEDK